MEKRNVIPFREFILDIVVNRCRLSVSMAIEMFDTDSSMGLCEQAFTHKSYDPVKNYDLMEIRGDVILNHAVIDWLFERFPDIANDVTNVGLITRTKHTLISNKFLASIAIAYNFINYIKVSEKELELARKECSVIEKSTKYIKLNGDVIEALCSAISIIIFKSTKSRGAGYSSCYDMISSFMDELKIDPIKADPITALKEFSDAMFWGCTVDDMIKVGKAVDGDRDMREIYKTEMRKLGKTPDREIDKIPIYYHIALGYRCQSTGKTFKDYSGKERPGFKKELLTYGYAPDKDTARHEVAKGLMIIYEKEGLKPPIREKKIYTKI